MFVIKKIFIAVDAFIIIDNQLFKTNLSTFRRGGLNLYVV